MVVNAVISNDPEAPYSDRRFFPIHHGLLLSLLNLQIDLNRTLLLTISRSDMIMELTLILSGVAMMIPFSSGVSSFTNPQRYCRLSCELNLQSQRPLLNV